MNRYLKFSIYLAAVAAASCQQEFLQAPTFDVWASQTEINPGDTVNFSFSGNPDFLTFYSGEAGRDYDFAGRIREAGTPVLRFNTTKNSGNQANTLRLLVSDSFSGVISGNEGETAANISKAEWTDITDRAVLSTGANTPSGAIELSDFAARDKPLYIAFRYSAESGTVQNRWTINNLTLSNSLSSGRTYTLANLTATAIANYGMSLIFSPGWVPCKIKNTFTWSATTSALSIAGAATDAAATSAAEAWVITGPLDLKKVAPDVGTFIKGMDIRTDTYPYIFTTPGVYNAAFVATSDNIYGKKEMVKKLTITVRP